MNLNPNRDGQGRGHIRSVSRANTLRLEAGLPELGISLKKRRRWFAGEDDENDDESNDDNQSITSLEDAKNYIEVLKKRVQENKDRASEYYDKNQNMEARVSAMETAARQRSEQDGDFERLYKEQLAVNEQLRPEAERGKSAIERIRASNDARIGKIPETLRKAVPIDYPPEKLQEYLDDNEGWMLRQPAPDYDGGLGGNNGEVPKPKLSADEIEAGKLMGLSEPDLLKAKGEDV